MQHDACLTPQLCDPRCISDTLARLESNAGPGPAGATGLHDLCIAIKARLDNAHEQRDRLLYTALYSDCLSEILRRARRATMSRHTQQ